MIIKQNDRKIEVKTLLQIIDNREEYKENSENGLVILVNGSWGTGKSTFIKLLINEISIVKKYEIFENYNAYEYDFYENAYIPFFATIEDKIKLKNNFSKFINSVTKEATKNIVVLSYAVTKSIFSKNLGINIDDIKNNLIDISKEESNQNYYKNFQSFKKIKDSVKDKMSRISSKKIQIFIIDELDRCKPDFAMDTLEIVKHFFDIKNCVFIIAVDKLQLEASAKAIYGQDINSEKYFSKLFDYQFNLSPINFYDSVDLSKIKEKDDLIKRVSDIFNILNISLRDSKKIFNEMIQKNNDWTNDQSVFMLFIFILKYTDLTFYNIILDGGYEKYSKIIYQNYENIRYSDMLSHGVGGTGKTFDDVIKELTQYRNMIFIDKKQLKTGTILYEDTEAKLKREVGIEMIQFIPQIEPDLSFMENVRKITE